MISHSTSSRIQTYKTQPYSSYFAGVTIFLFFRDLSLYLKLGSQSLHAAPPSPVDRGVGLGFETNERSRVSSY